MIRQYQQIVWLILFALVNSITFAAVDMPQVVMPSSKAFTANDVAVIINDSDPLSVKIGRYYQRKRNIADENIIHINFEPNKDTMHPGKFAVLKSIVEARTPEHVQAYVLTWAAPYKVGCMSISSAFAFGYDVKYCAKGCKPTFSSRYYNSTTHKPYDHFAVRPTMLLAADNYDDAKALIDRGLAADGSLRKGRAYLLETSDRNRSVRKVFFPSINNQLSNQVDINILKTDTIQNRNNIMFYFTGLKWVDAIDSNQYLPGAIADHLTSTGGKLTGGNQMSAMKWLQAGATGSYGTVVEPCNLTTKFPNPLIVMNRYLHGESLIEAYWKSVKMPGQGVFIGDPLAKPYAGFRLQKYKEGLLLSSPQLKPGFYVIKTADTLDGPFELLTSGIEISAYKKTIELSKPFAAVYSIEPLLNIGEPIELIIK